MDLKTLHDTPPWDWPENTDKMLLDILQNRHADENDRMLAAELAGDLTVVNDDLVDILLSILNYGDASQKLREKAAISLGPILEQADEDGFEDPDDVPISDHTFLNIKKLLHNLYLNPDVPKSVRRRILEASVRAPEEWHRNAIRAAYVDKDEEWRLTAVFSMRWIRGFDPQILEALESNNDDLHFQAVCAAGNWEIDAAWPHVSGLITSGDTDKSLLLAAIDAAINIRPKEAGPLLVDLTDSDDGDIVDAVYEAMAMAESLAEIEELDDDVGID